jgi:hypothetical protein
MTLYCPEDLIFLTNVHQQPIQLACIFIANMDKYLTIAFLLFFGWHLSAAQQITGVVADRDGQTPLQNVQISNVHSNVIVFCDSIGKFAIQANKGQLIEMRKAGYKTTRFRLPRGYMPSYFKIYMEQLVELNTDIYASSQLTQFQKDSINDHELYKVALNFPKMSGLEKIESPFSAMSKKNREKWAFQESYATYEKEKFIDYTFSPSLITSLTGLKGDSLNVYMRRYRPTYEQLRSMNLYEYYNFVKHSVEFYRRRSGRSGPRNSG